MLDQVVNDIDVVIIGGGQAGLATAYFLKRSSLNFVILDAEESPGGSWLHGWQSLRLFSPAAWSSLPGKLMPNDGDQYPTRQRVVDYINEYEKRYKFLIKRPVRVQSVWSDQERLIVKTNQGIWRARAVISTTGTWNNPFIPSYVGQDLFQGSQIHSANYQSPEAYQDQKVLIIGGGNSGAQILSEVSKFAKTVWVTQEPPLFLADDVDGRVLFERATERWKASQEGSVIDLPKGGLGDVVMVPAVRDARLRGVLIAHRPFREFVQDGVIWQDGVHEKFDAVIWCTGFRPALQHFAALKIIEDDGKIKVKGTRSLKQPNIWLVGYGEWTGYASATLIGVSRTAKSTAEEVSEYLFT